MGFYKGYIMDILIIILGFIYIIGATINSYLDMKEGESDEQ